MDLIIGGAYQGKCTFAAEKYRLTAADICDLATDAPAPARCYVHLEALTRRGEAAEALPLLLAAEAVISREIGSGVVPMDAGERAWRERHGRLLRRLAQQAGRMSHLGTSQLLYGSVLEQDDILDAYDAVTVPQLRQLAEQAGHVYRIFCGLTEELK